ncbi:hypothetical protein U0070_019572, partial [Myodes glareolus]
EVPTVRDVEGQLLCLNCELQVGLPHRTAHSLGVRPWASHSASLSSDRLMRRLAAGQGSWPPKRSTVGRWASHGQEAQVSRRSSYPTAAAAVQTQSLFTG